MRPALANTRGERRVIRRAFLELVPEELSQREGVSEDAVRRHLSRGSAILGSMIDAALLAPERIRPLSRCEYDALVASGHFADERIELLDGMLVAMSPQDPLHANTVSRLAERLTERLRGRAHVQTQCPIAIGGRSEPEPDIAVVPVGDYSREHPDHAFLLVEVASSSLRKDREVKGRLYAEASIPEYWLVNLEGNQIEVFTDPRDGRYTSSRIASGEDEITPRSFTDASLPVAAILS
jgi:Uma2 family endonuclease